MADRYFVSQPIQESVVRLGDEEAHHLIHVMRAKPGEDVVLFDGNGCEWEARVVRVARAEVELKLITRRTVDRELPCDVTLAVALPKGDRQRWLVEKAVELGVRQITPLITARGIAQIGDTTLARLRRTVIEASKQCGRNRLLEITSAANCVDYFAAPPPAGGLRWLADPSGERPLASFFNSAGCSSAGWLTFAIGPEGGFTEREIDVGRSHGWAIVTLGPRILRVETAALYAAALAC